VKRTRVREERVWAAMQQLELTLFPRGVKFVISIPARKKTMASPSVEPEFEEFHSKTQLTQLPQLRSRRGAARGGVGWYRGRGRTSGGACAGSYRDSASRGSDVATSSPGAHASDTSLPPPPSVVPTLTSPPPPPTPSLLTQRAGTSEPRPVRLRRAVLRDADVHPREAKARARRNRQKSSRRC
jgi:hypothetical protein